MNEWTTRKEDSQRTAQERQSLQAYREDRARVEAIQESRDKLSRLDYALADIRDALRGFPDDHQHPYVIEKLAERDKILTEHSRETATLEKLEKDQATLTGHRQIMAALDPGQSRRVYRVIIDLENSAFDGLEAGGRYELADILQYLAESVQCGDMEQTIQDSNGNTVGHAEVIETSAQ